MLAVAAAAVRDTTKDGSHGCGGIMSESSTATVNTFSFNPEEDQFPDLGDSNLLESIDFDDLFAGINDGDVLPDLEMDPDILGEFSASGGEESSGKSTTEDDSNYHHHQRRQTEEEEEEDHHQAGDKLLVFGSGKGDEIVNSKREGSNSKRENNYEKGRKSSSGQSTKNNNQGKRKVKVDWTPELHRRFVQAVEQLGVDKAVPSRILELMGIDCLTRHNIASHLQKYRSHRKHLLAREAEAASWTQRRQMYGGSAVAGGGGAGKRSEMSRWMGPTMGFPPPAIHFRPPPLHVWGHPSLDQTLLHVWPKHLTHPSLPPPSAWIPTRPPPHPSFWHPHGPAVPNGPSPGAPCFPQAIPATRIGAAAAAVGVPHQQQQQLQVPTGQMGPHPHPFDPQPWKESIDEAIGDVLSKPWQALPLGLKPPSIDSVMVELQRQGVPKVPPNPNISPPHCASPLLNSTTSSSAYD